MKKRSLKHMAFTAVATALLANAVLSRASDADQAVESSFKNSYVNKTYLKDDAVKVEAKDGVVTLTGTVSEESSKNLAQETAARLPGVNRVDNQLQTKAEVATENADAWTARKVKFALRFHRNVSGGNTEVDVVEGVVTLKGEASSLAQKELTAEYAKDIEGVKDVKNEMTVAAAPVPPVQTVGEKLDDASITAQVKLALLTHRSTSAVKTQVETRDGEVTLTGIAKNDAEKSLVTKLASDIHGVTTVKNQMTVAEAM